jgi:hypothetical protein
MAVVALVLSICIAVLGALSMVAPGQLTALVRSMQTRTGLYSAAAIRVVLGMALVFAAPASRAPGVIWVIGIVVFVAGLITPVIGLERFRQITDWFLGWGAMSKRVWGLVALWFGAWLAYAVWPW